MLQRFNDDLYSPQVYRSLQKSINIQGLENYNPSLTKDSIPYPGLSAVLTGQSFTDIDSSHSSHS